MTATSAPVFEQASIAPLGKAHIMPGFRCYEGGLRGDRRVSDLSHRSQA